MEFNDMHLEDLFCEKKKVGPRSVEIGAPYSHDTHAGFIVVRVRSTGEAVSALRSAGICMQDDGFAAMYMADVPSNEFIRAAVSMMDRVTAVLSKL